MEEKEKVMTFDDMTDEQIVKIYEAAKRKLEEPEVEVETPDGEQVEIKNPTGISALDPNQAIQREQDKGFGGKVNVLHESTKRTMEDFRLGWAILGKCGVWMKDAGMEREWVRQHPAILGNLQEKAVLEVSDDALGGFLVPTEAKEGITPMLRARAVFQEAGANMWENAPYDFTVTLQTAASTAYDIGMGAQTSAITASNPTLGQIHERLRRMGARVQLDVDLLRATSERVEQFVRKDIAKSIALRGDLWCWSGNGGVQPNGILNWPGISTTCMTGLSSVKVTVDNLIDACSSIEGREGEITDRAAFFGHPTQWNIVRKLKTGDQIYHIIPDLQVGLPRKQLLGIPWYSTTQITNTYIGLCADMDEFVIAEGGDMEIFVLNKNMDQLQIDIIAVYRMTCYPHEYRLWEILYECGT